MTSVTIRPYLPSDIEHCRELWTQLTQHHRDLYNDATIGGDSPRLQFDKHLARVGADHIWVAEQNGEVTGIVGLIVEEESAEIEPIVVTSTRRGQGVGRALLDRAIVEARRLSVRYLTVRPVARNSKVFSFYRDAGFGTLGKIELFMELRATAAGKWQSSIELWGCAFDY